MVVGTSSSFIFLVGNITISVPAIWGFLEAKVKFSIYISCIRISSSVTISVCRIEFSPGSRDHFRDGRLLLVDADLKFKRYFVNNSLGVIQFFVLSLSPVTYISLSKVSVIPDIFHKLIFWISASTSCNFLTILFKLC